MTVSHLGPRTLGATLTGHVASFDPVARALGLPPVDFDAPKAFTFRRRKREGRWGWEIGLHIGRLWLNLSCCSTDPSPHLRTRDEARAWAIRFAERHGFQPMEQPQPRRRKRPDLRLVVTSSDARREEG